MNRRIRCHNKQARFMYTSFFKRERQHDPFRAKEIIIRGILPQHTSQIYMYTSFFKRERQYDPFRAKEIMNRRILPQQTSQIYVKECEPNHTLNTMYILRSQSVQAQTHAKCMYICKYNVYSSFLKRASPNTGTLKTIYNI